MPARATAVTVATSARLPDVAGSSDVRPVVLIVLAFNHARYLDALFRTIQSNLTLLSELVLVDNGSSDNSRARLEGFAQTLRANPDGPTAITQTNPPGTGVAWALNRAMAASKAPYVAVIAGDDFLLARRFEAQVSALDADPEAAFVYSNGLVCDDADKLSEVHVHDSHARRVLQAADTSTRPSLLYPIPALFTHCALFRRVALQSIGGWDESLAIDDWPLNIRLFERYSTGCRWVEGAVAAYRRHASNASKRRFRQYLGQKRIIERLGRGHDLKRARFALFATQALASLKRRQWTRSQVFARAAFGARPGLRFILHWFIDEIRRRVQNKIR
jgi:GT2 family glycosyltransferase